MKLCIISGSNRANSESIRVAKFVEQNIELLNPEIQTEIVDLYLKPIPLFDGKQDLENSNLVEIKASLGDSDGFVVITPEWNGMASPAIKNLLATFNSEFSHKPALIISVSSGRGGALPAAELRMNSYKNNHICYIPEQVIIRDVNNLSLDYNSTEIDKVESFIRKRIDYNLKVLMEYSKALELVQNSQVIDSINFGNGMS